MLINEWHPEDDQNSGRNTSRMFNKRKLKGVYLCLAFYVKCRGMKLISMGLSVKKSLYSIRGGVEEDLLKGDTEEIEKET